MTTIITKNGSGAPTAGQLSQGELAVDLTNKELYTKSGSTVIKIGGTGGGETGTFTDLTATSSFTSPGIDDNATSTAITIDANENVLVNNASFGSLGQVVVQQSSDDKGIAIVDSTASDTFTIENNAASCKFHINTGKDFVFSNTSSDTERMVINASGNVGINASNPTEKLHVGGNALIGGEIESDASGTTAGFKWGQDTATHYWKWAEFNNGTASLQNNSTSSASSTIAVTTTGNVGINETNPSKLLHVKGSGSSARMLLQSTSAGDGLLQFKNQSTASGFYVGLSGALTGDGIIYHEDAKDVVISTSATERMRIDASGNVGIGASNPAENLHVYGTNPNLLVMDSPTSYGSQDAGIILTGRDPSDSSPRVATQWRMANVGADLQFNYGGSSTPSMVIKRTSGNVGIGAPSPNRQLHVKSLGTGDSRNVLVDTTGANGNAGIGFASNGNEEWALATIGTTGAQDLRLYNWNNSAEAMRIDVSGNLLVGRTASGAGVDSGVQISPDGSSYWDGGTSGRSISFTPNSIDLQSKISSEYDGGTASRYFTGFTHNNTNKFQVSHAGQIYATSTSITGLSDASLKENVRDLDKGLDTIKALKPRRFDWINGDGTDIMGFVAQEVEEVMPEIVQDYEYAEGESKKGIKMGDMIPSLVKAMQEQQAMIETLQAEVAALKGA